MNQHFGIERLKAGQGWYLILLLVLIAFYTNGLSYTYWDSKFVGRIIKLMYVLLLVYFIYILPNISEYRFYKIVLLLTFLPFLSIGNSYFIYNQSIMKSLSLTMLNFIWLIYFPLKAYRVRESTIFHALLITSIVILVIQVVQQFTYPTAYFGVRSEEQIIETYGEYVQESEIAEMRNGLWRFRMDFNGFFTAPIIFAVLIWLKRKFSNNKMVLLVALLISIYLSLTRQVIFSVLMTIFLSFFLGRKKGNARSFVIAISLIACLVFFYDQLFTSLSQQTQEESHKSNVRILAAAHFINDIFKTPFTFLFGYGDAADTGAFRRYMNILANVYGFNICDVGFIGKTWQYGIIYVIVCYYLLYILFFKYKQKIPIYIRLFVLYTTIMSPMIFPFYRGYYHFVWVMLLYVCELHINESPLIMMSNSQHISHKLNMIDKIRQSVVNMSKK